jgi:hypothetical protein
MVSPFAAWMKRFWKNVVNSTAMSTSLSRTTLVKLGYDPLA